jgi:hypothetical protein
MLVPLIDAETLRNTVSSEVYLAVFDDQRTGDVSQVDQSGPVMEVIDDANVLVISRLPPIYKTIPDGTDPTISVLLKTAIRMYLRYFTFSRRPEYTRVTGRDETTLLKKADSIMDEVQAGILRIAPADSPPEATPRNVGGLILSSSQLVMLPNTDGSFNSGDF